MRWKRIFIQRGSPVIISAGALLKDNQSGAILVQLKVKNISRRRLRAAIVRIFSYDSFGKPTGTEEKEYLDLMVVRGEEFGQKVLIPVSNAAARSFTATVTWCRFHRRYGLELRRRRTVCFAESETSCKGTERFGVAEAVSTEIRSKRAGVARRV